MFIKSILGDIANLSIKLKTLLGVLVLIAVFSVLRVTGLFGTISPANISGQLDTADNDLLPVSLPAFKTQLVFNEIKDGDGDGINDQDEVTYDKLSDQDPDSDGDGYYDGEEIVTGYDPSKNESEIKIANPLNKNNLTLALIDNMTAGIFAGAIKSKKLDTGDLKTNIETLALATLDSTNQALVKQPRIILSTDDGAAQSLYLQQLSEMLEEPVLAIISGGSQPAFATATHDLINGRTADAHRGYAAIADSFSEAYDHMSALAVPPAFKTWHEATLDVLYQMTAAHRELAAAPEDDPVRSILAMNLISRQTVVAQGLLQNLRILIAKNNVSVPKSVLFTTLDLLNVHQ